MPHFAAAQIECHAVSLRGSEGSPSDAATVRTAEHVADLAAFVEEHLRRPPVMVGGRPLSGFTAGADRQ